MAPGPTGRSNGGEPFRRLLTAQLSDVVLKALLGGPRAEMLRRLDHPVTAGWLAESMRYVPSAICHHLLILERAGLVERIGGGRQVQVHRTARGSALLDLYALGDGLDRSGT